MKTKTRQTPDTYTAKKMETAAEQRGLDLVAFSNNCGGIFTTPPVEDWPKGLRGDVSKFAKLDYGPYGPYWMAR